MLGAKCDSVSVAGNDSVVDLVKERLLEQGIGNSLVTDKSRPTTFKKRYVGNHKLFQVV